MICTLISVGPYVQDNYNIRWTHMKNKHRNFEDKAENNTPGGLYTL